MDLVKRVTIWLMLFIGLGCCVLGFVIGGVEAIHLLRGTHGFEYPPFVGAGIFIIGGAALVQNGNVKEALGVLTDNIPLLRSTKPGGMRATDPELPVKKKEEQ